MLAGVESVVAEASGGWATFSGASEITTTATTTVFADQSFAIEGGQTYELSGAAISGEDGQHDPSRRQYFGLASYDSSGRLIHPYHYNHRVGSAQTTLASPLSASSTSIHLADATGWEGSDGAAVVHWKAAIAWWDAQSEYTPYTYSPNRAVGTSAEPLWDRIEGGRLHLPAGKTFGDYVGTAFATLPAGTPVMNTTSGGTYDYTAAQNRAIGETLTTLSGRISATGFDEAGDAIDRFRPGTASVRPVMLANYGSGGTNTISWQDVRFESVDESHERFAAGDAITLRPTGISDQENWSYTWRQVDGPAVSLATSTAGAVHFDAPILGTESELAFEVRGTAIAGGVSQVDRVTLTIGPDAGLARLAREELAAEASTHWATFGGPHRIGTKGTETLAADGLIAVDQTREYVLTGDAISGGGGLIDPDARHYFGLISYDDQQRVINPQSYLKRAGAAETTLAAPLSAESTTIQLTSAAGWEGQSGAVNWTRAALAWWGAGNPYDEYVYSPDHAVGSAAAPLWGHVQGNTLYLPAGKTFGDYVGTSFSTLPIGTPIMNTTLGGWYDYIGASNEAVGDELTTFSGRIAGAAVDTNGRPVDRFRPYTRFVRPAVFPNRNAAGTNRVDWQDIRFEEVAAATGNRYEHGQHVTLRPTGLSDSFTWSYVWRQLSGPRVPLQHVVDGGRTFAVPRLLHDGEMRFEVVASRDGAGDGCEERRSEVVVAVAGDANGDLNAYASRTYDETGQFSEVVSGQRVRLIANSLRDDSSVTYTWEQVAGPAVPLDRIDSWQGRRSDFVVPTWIGESTLAFRVTAADAKSRVSQIVRVKTVPASQPAFAATATVAGQAVAGPVAQDTWIDLAVPVLPGASSYSWRQVAGPTALVQNVSGPTPRLRTPTGLVGRAALVFEATASDGQTSRVARTRLVVEAGAGAISATATATGAAGSHPSPPIQLGLDWPNQSAFPNASVRWRQVGGPEVAVVNATSAAGASAQPTSFAQATYRFEVSVRDADSVLIRRVAHTVTPAPEQTRNHIAEVFATVRNEIHFEPSRWRTRSAAAVENTGTGNAWDQSALLAERLEDEGLASAELGSIRFATGRVELTFDQLTEWLGTDTRQAAWKLLYDANLNPVGLPGRYQFDHAWLRVHVPGDDGVKHWVDLDPAYKPLLPGRTSVAPLTPQLDDLLGTGWRRVHFDEDFNALPAGQSAPPRLLATKDSKVRVVDDRAVQTDSNGKPIGSAAEKDAGNGTDNSLQLSAGEGFFFDERSAIDGTVSLDLTRLAEGVQIFGRSSTAGEYGLSFWNDSTTGKRMWARLYARNSNGGYTYLPGMSDGTTVGANAQFPEIAVSSHPDGNARLWWNRIDKNKTVHAEGRGAVNVEFSVSGSVVSATIKLYDPNTGAVFQTMELSHTFDAAATNRVSSPGRFGVRAFGGSVAGSNDEYLPRVDNIEATLLAVNHDTAADRLLRESRSARRDPQRQPIRAIAARDVFANANGSVTRGLFGPTLVGTPSVSSAIETARVKVSVVSDTTGSYTTYNERTVEAPNLDGEQVSVLTRFKGKQVGGSSLSTFSLTTTISEGYGGGAASQTTQIAKGQSHRIRTVQIDPSGSEVPGTEVFSSPLAVPKGTVWNKDLNVARRTAVGLDFGQHSSESLGALKDLERVTLADEQLHRSTLSQIASDYFRQANQLRREVDATTGYVSARRGPATAFVTADVSGWDAAKPTSYRYRPKNLSIDVPAQRDESIPRGWTGHQFEAAAARRSRLLVAALSESTLESRVISAAVDQAAASAASILAYQDSLSQSDPSSGVDVYHLVALSGGRFDDLRTSNSVDFANLASLKAALQFEGVPDAESVEDDIAAYLQAGVGEHFAIVANEPAPTPVDSSNTKTWSGIAYVTINEPAGTFDSILVGSHGEKLHGGIEVPGATTPNSGDLLETVDTFSGAVRRTDTEFSITRLGVNVEFSRLYDSRFNGLTIGTTTDQTYLRNTGFGSGWRHSFDASLRTKKDEYVVLRDSDGSEVRFAWTEDDAGEPVFVSPIDRHDLRLTSETVLTTSGHEHRVFRITSLDGTVREFGVAGNATAATYNDVHLTRTTDRYGNEVNIQRAMTDPGVAFDTTSLRDQTVGLSTRGLRILSVSVATPDGRQEKVLEFANGSDPFIDSIEVLPDVGSTQPRRWDYNYHGFAGESRVITVTGPALPSAQGGPSVTRYRYVDAVGAANAGNGVAEGDRARWSSANAAGLLAWAEGPGTHRVEYYYGANKRVEKTIEQIGTDDAPAEGVTRYRYDVYRGTTTITDPEGRATELRHSAGGQLIETVSPEGVRTTSEYDEARNLLIGSVDGIGRATRVEYDEHNRQTLQVDPTGLELHTQYEGAAFGDSLNEAENTSNPDAGRTLPRYGRPTVVTRAAPGETDAFYTVYGYGEVLRDGGLFTFVRTVSNRSPLGHEAVLGMANSRIARQTMDLQGRPVEQYGPLLPSEVVDAEAFTTYSSYDAVTGLPTATFVGSTGHPDGQLKIADRTYDPATGYLTASYSADIGWIGYETDIYGRITAEYHADTETGQFDATSDRISRHTYDGKGRLIETESFEGLTTTFEYNAAGWKTAEIVRGADGNELARREWRYNLDGTVAAETDPVGARTEFVYNAGSQVSQIIHADGGVESYRYGVDGQVVWHQTPGGVATAYSYDDFGRVTEVVAADGSTVSQTYDAWGRLETMTDARGLQTRYDYDAFDNVVRRRIGSERVEETTFDARGAALSTTVYDVSGLAWAGSLQVMSEAALRTQLDALPVSRVRTASTDYDVHGRAVARTDAVGTTTTITYDARGRKATEADARGAVTTYTYDVNTGRVLTMTRAAADIGEAVTRYTYDLAGRVIALTTPDGAVTRTRYDELGRAVAQTDASGNTTERAYDAAGRVVAVTDALGNTTTTEYDEVGRVVSTIGAAVAVVGATTLRSPRVGREYDRDGRVVSQRDPLGRITRYRYDEMGRLTHTIGPAVQDENDLWYHPVAERTYTAAGDLESETTGLTLPQGDAGGATPDRTHARTMSYVYDVFGRKTRSLGITPDASQPTARPTTSMTYNGFGEVVSETSALGLSTTFTRDAAGRVLTRTIADPDGDGPGQSATFRFTYDAAGQTLTETDANDATTRFAYDGFGRRTATRLPFVAIGDRSVVAAPTTATVYDIMARVVAEVDARGAVTQNRYDDAGRLVATTLPDPDGSGPLTATTLTKRYDALGRVVEETDAIGRKKRTFYDAGGRVVDVVEVAADGTASRFSSRKYDLAGQVVWERDTLGRITTHQYDAAGRKTRTTLPDPDGDDPLPSRS